MTLGVPTSAVSAVNELGASMSTAGGFANDGWFVRLKKSARNRKLCRSVSRKLFPTVKSKFFCVGPIKQFRGTFPTSVASPGDPSDSGITGAGWKAAVCSKPGMRPLIPPCVTLFEQLKPGAKTGVDRFGLLNEKALPPSESTGVNGSPDC